MADIEDGGVIIVPDSSADRAWIRISPTKLPKSMKQKRIGKHLSRHVRDKKAVQMWIKLEDSRIMKWFGADNG